MQKPPPKSRLYRIVVAPRTLYMFRKYFKAAGEPRPLWNAARYTWRTL
jgi:hypothetical protein